MEDAHYPNPPNSDPDWPEPADPRPAVWMPQGSEPASAEGQSLLGAEAARQWLHEEPRSVGDAMAEAASAHASKVAAYLRSDWDHASWWGGYCGQISAAITEALGR